ncbi:MAG: hypothetical protein CM1200mP16_14220 [Nitrospina sp.]|nr:MAG: hypothetical protein CM1200mP16_14220 [Nitrospina sp.]
MSLLPKPVARNSKNHHIDRRNYLPKPRNIKNTIEIKNGTIHKLSKDRGNYETLNFDRYDITLSLPETKKLERKALAGNKELSLGR